jgi:alkylation response protein AidB-like acyl-CoA dehydrogenase
MPDHAEGYGARCLESARRLACRFAETAGDHDRSGVLPRSNFAHLFDAGLLSLTVAPRYGGPGAGLELAREIVGIIAGGDPSTALILAMQYSQYAQMAHGAPWPAALAEQLGRAALDGLSLINSAQVEPELGSPSHGGVPKTVARRVDGGWRLSGRKIYVTGIPLLDRVNVVAVTDDPEPLVGYFIVPARAPGITIIETWDAIGMRATGSHDMLLDNVQIPAGNGFGFAPAAGGLVRDGVVTAWFLTLVASVYNGAARAARNWLVEFLKTRTPSNLGQPLATLPLVQDKVGEIEVLLRASDRLLRNFAAEVDRGIADLGAALPVKHEVIQNALDVTLLALDLAGNHGTSRLHPLERHHRDVLCGRIHSPQNALIRGTLGRRALGVGA